MSALHVVLNEIAILALGEGDRLPSERVLAERCVLSRTSIRNALKELQARSILASRERSGYYLASSFALQQALSGKGKTWDLQRILQLIEARNFVEPPVAAMSAIEIVDDNLWRLEQCLVDMGKATVGDSAEQLASCHNLFFTICQDNYVNQEFVRMLDEVRIPLGFLVSVLRQISEIEKNRFFADHVNLFQALKQQNAETVQGIIEQLNNRIADFFRDYSGAVFSERRV